MSRKSRSGRKSMEAKILKIGLSQDKEWKKLENLHSQGKDEKVFQYLDKIENDVIPKLYSKRYEYILKTHSEKIGALKNQKLTKSEFYTQRNILNQWRDEALRKNEQMSSEEKGIYNSLLSRAVSRF